MIIDIRKFKEIKSAPNSAYDVVKPEFLYHSNKLEGSTFTLEELQKLVDEGHVSGDHGIDDVIETMNSLEVFDYIVDTLGKPVSDELLFEMNRLLLKGTTYDKEGWTGHYKTIPNRIRGAAVEVSLPKDVPDGMKALFADWENSGKELADIAGLHARFERIHPFQDGNGRIGRFLILKQCVEGGIDLVSIDEEFNRPYKSWLEYAQTTGDPAHLVEVFEDCRHRFDEKMRAQGVDRLLDF